MLYLGCKETYDSVKAGLNQNLTPAPVETTLSFSCPQAQADTEKLIGSAAVKICTDAASPTGCHGQFSGKGKLTWTLGCGKCPSNTNCFDCDGSGCNIATAGKFVGKTVTKCVSFHGAKGQVKSGESIYCAGDAKCNRLEYSDGSKYVVWSGCAVDCIEFRKFLNKGECKEVEEKNAASGAGSSAPNKPAAKDQSGDKKAASKPFAGLGVSIPLMALAARAVLL